MKKIILALLLLFLCGASSFAQEVSIINGVWERGKNTANVKLYKIDKGELHEIASTKLDENLQFAFAFQPKEEGYYVIGVSANAVDRHTFYFKPGDRLNVKVTFESYELIGDNNTPENKEMARWQEFVAPLEQMAVRSFRNTYVEFFPLFEEKLSEMANYSKANTPNAAFNSSFERYKECNILYLSLHFTMTPRTAHPQGEDYPDYYRNLDLAAITRDDFLLKFPQGMDLLLNTYLTTIRLNDNISGKEKEQIIADPAAFLLNGKDSDKLSNDILKGEIAVKLGRRNKTLAGFSDYKAKYQKYIITDDQKKRWQKIEAGLNENVAGSDALDFKFPDINGKEIALSDFKGKVVYIDVWATWCGPCKKEFPHLKELEAAYHGNNGIVFMGVNVDISKDIQKWKNFLEKEQLPGIQIFAGDRARDELMTPYKIKGIPRFILVGKDGKLIFADAPRPSSAEVKAVIDDAIKK